MRKSFKKLLCVVMVMIMAMSVMACGSKSKKSNLEKLSAEELTTKVSTASEGVECVSGKSDMNVVLSMGGTEMTMSGNMEMKSIKEPLQAYVKADMKMAFLGQEQPISYEVYEVTTEDGSAMDTYMYDGSEWTYQSVDMTETNKLTSELTELMSSIDYSKVAEYFDDINAKTSGNNYVVTMKASSSKVIEKLQDSELASALEKVDLSAIPEIEITASMTVDGKTFLPKTMTMTATMDKMEYEGMELELKECEINYTYDSFENVEIEIPEAALAAK